MGNRITTWCADVYKDQVRGVVQRLLSPHGCTFGDFSLNASSVLVNHLVWSKSLKSGCHVNLKVETAEIELSKRTLVLRSAKVAIQCPMTMLVGMLAHGLEKNSSQQQRDETRELLLESVKELSSEMREVLRAVVETQGAINAMKSVTVSSGMLEELVKTAVQKASLTLETLEISVEPLDAETKDVRVDVVVPRLVCTVKAKNNQEAKDPKGQNAFQFETFGTVRVGLANSRAAVLSIGDSTFGIETNPIRIHASVPLVEVDSELLVDRGLFVLSALEVPDVKQETQEKIDPQSVTAPHVERNEKEKAKVTKPDQVTTQGVPRKEISTTREPLSMAPTKDTKTFPTRETTETPCNEKEETTPSRRFDQCNVLFAVGIQSIRSVSSDSSLRRRNEFPNSNRSELLRYLKQWAGWVEFQGTSIKLALNAAGWSCQIEKIGMLVQEANVSPVTVLFHLVDADASKQCISVMRAEIESPTLDLSCSLSRCIVDLAPKSPLLSLDVVQLRQLPTKTNESMNLVLLKRLAFRLQQNQRKKAPEDPAVAPLAASFGAQSSFYRRLWEPFAVAMPAVAEAAGSDEPMTYDSSQPKALNPFLTASTIASSKTTTPPVAVSRRKPGDLRQALSPNLVASCQLVSISLLGWLRWYCDQKGRSSDPTKGKKDRECVDASSKTARIVFPEWLWVLRFSMAIQNVEFRLATFPMEEVNNPLQRESNNTKSSQTTPNLQQDLPRGGGDPPLVEFSNMVFETTDWDSIEDGLKLVACLGASPWLAPTKASRKRGAPLNLEMTLFDNEGTTLECNAHFGNMTLYVGPLTRHLLQDPNFPSFLQNLRTFLALSPTPEDETLALSLRWTMKLWRCAVSMETTTPLELRANELTIQFPWMTFVTPELGLFHPLSGARVGAIVQASLSKGDRQTRVKGDFLGTCTVGNLGHLRHATKDIQSTWNAWKEWSVRCDRTKPMNRLFLNIPITPTRTIPVRAEPEEPQEPHEQDDLAALTPSSRGSFSSIAPFVEASQSNLDPGRARAHERADSYFPHAHPCSSKERPDYGKLLQENPPVWFGPPTLYSAHFAAPNKQSMLEEWPNEEATVVIESSAAIEFHFGEKAEKPVLWTCVDARLLFSGANLDRREWKFKLTVAALRCQRLKTKDSWSSDAEPWLALQQLNAVDLKGSRTRRNELSVSWRESASGTQIAAMSIQFPEVRVTASYSAFCAANNLCELFSNGSHTNANPVLQQKNLANPAFEDKTKKPHKHAHEDESKKKQERTEKKQLIIERFEVNPTQFSFRSDTIGLGVVELTLNKVSLTHALAWSSCLETWRQHWCQDVAPLKLQKLLLALSPLQSITNISSAGWELTKALFRALDGGTFENFQFSFRPSVLSSSSSPATTPERKSQQPWRAVSQGLQTFVRVVKKEGETFGEHATQGTHAVLRAASKPLPILQPLARVFGKIVQDNQKAKTQATKRVFSL